MLIGIVVLNAVTATTYTRDTEMVASDFSYTPCGLTKGGIWSDCPDR